MFSPIKTRGFKPFGPEEMNPFLDHTKLGCTFLCEPLESTSEGKKSLQKPIAKR